MKIVFATGIYHPDIGGPATYVRSLAKECMRHGHEVTVVTYKPASRQKYSDTDSWPVHRVSRFGGPLLRWIRYASALRKHGKNSDVVYAFSSVSCALPLAMARLKKPKKILRLGGDFLWERYTDRGGEMSLREWYESNPSGKGLMQKLLNTCDHLVFSTAFQQNLYKDHYDKLPPSSVIENAFAHEGALIGHGMHDPFRLLFMGRFVGFKNLLHLIDALVDLPDVALTLVGDGPMKNAIIERAYANDTAERLSFIEPLFGSDKRKIFRDSDLLIIPSVTEISPNTALEARCEGLPILLTEETGLSEKLRDGMIVRPLRTVEEITEAVTCAIDEYDQVSSRAAVALPMRTWESLYRDHEKLFSSQGQ